MKKKSAEKESEEKLIEEYISDSTKQTPEIPDKDIEKVENNQNYENVGKDSEKYIVNNNNNEIMDSLNAKENKNAETNNMDVDITSDCSSGDHEPDIAEGKNIEREFSDSDSAFSSISTVQTSKSKDIEDETNLYVGQIVWGSFSFTSWYPCIIYPSESNTDDKVLVKYFNYNGFIAFLRRRNIFEFKGMDEFWQEMTHVRKISKSKIKFGKSCQRAIEEAKCFQSFPICDRTKLLDHIVDIQKSLPTPEEIATSVEEIDDEAIKSNLRIFFKTMQEYEEKQKSMPQIVNTEVKRKAIVKKIEVKSENEQKNRRLSDRLDRKRKLEEDDSISAQKTLPIPEEVSAKMNLQPPIKKPKIKKEETLEERFLSEVKDIYFLFKNVTKNKVCTKCLIVDDTKPTYRCCEKNCSNWNHEECFKNIDWRKEQFRHKTGDSDDIIETDGLRPFYLCETCASGIKKCFTCSQEIKDDDENIFHCTNSECKLSFHISCLRTFPRNRLCPQHHCHTCQSKNMNKSGLLAKCIECVAAYHGDINCIPAGTQILSRTQIICPRHDSSSRNEKPKKGAKSKNLKPLNIDWCSICTKAGSLVCCEGCPNAFHVECLGDKLNVSNDEVFMCEECLEGTLPLYNTLVWARVGHYRWWPGFVLPPWTVPLSILKNQTSPREFCIRFFGSSDFTFTTCERVFPYYPGEDNCVYVKTGNSRLDSVYHQALLEANELTSILRAESEKTGQSNLKPKHYKKIAQCRPVPPVKLKKLDEHSIERCECKPTDPTPCGRNSNCLNMLLNVECDKSCSAGVNCQNQSLRNRNSLELKISKTVNRGFGAFCINDIESDTFVIEYVGELIDNAELNRRMEEKIKRKEREFYFLTVQADLYVDAEFYSNKSRFLNHSCNPNCETRKVSVDGNTRIGIFTNQFIKAGTELTFDYKMQFVGNRKTSCLCGAPNCTGLIGDAKKIDEEKPKKQEKKINKRQRRRSKNKSVEPKRRISKSHDAEIEKTLNPFDIMMEVI